MPIFAAQNSYEGTMCHIAMWFFCVQISTYLKYGDAISRAVWSGNAFGSSVA